MTLPDVQRGGAWPSSVRTVRRSVKSDNERDPRPLLPPLSREGTHIVETAGAKSEEGEVDGRSVCPECPGLHARYIGGDKGPLRRKATVNPKPCRGLDRGLQLTLVKMDSVVIVSQDLTVNMPLLLAHTARQTTRVVPE